MGENRYVRLPLSATAGRETPRLEGRDGAGAREFGAGARVGGLVGEGARLCDTLGGEGAQGENDGDGGQCERGRFEF